MMGADPVWPESTPGPRTAGAADAVAALKSGGSTTLVFLIRIRFMENLWYPDPHVIFKSIRLTVTCSHPLMSLRKTKYNQS